jgi:hypothetical protein
MATFVDTTLTKRTGATTTVFEPRGIDNGVAYLRSAADYSFAGHYLTVSQKVANTSRRTVVRVGIPQLDSSGLVVLSKPFAQLEMFIPEATKQSDVNDLVGYLNALTATGLTNFNDILVEGVGIY